jgi:uncharacterized membrane protein YwzB
MKEKIIKFIKDNKPIIAVVLMILFTILVGGILVWYLSYFK